MPGDHSQTVSVVMPCYNGAEYIENALDSAIAAQQRNYTAAKRRYYAPDVGLSAALDQIVAKHEGSDDLGDVGALLPCNVCLIAVADGVAVRIAGLERGPGRRAVTKASCPLHTVRSQRCLCADISALVWRACQRP